MGSNHISAMSPNLAANIFFRPSGRATVRQTFFAAHGVKPTGNGITFHYGRGSDPSRVLLVCVNSLLIVPEPGNQIAMSRFGLWWSINPSAHHVGEICIDRKTLDAAPPPDFALLLRINFLIIHDGVLGDGHPTIFVHSRLPPSQIEVPEKTGTYAIHAPSGIPLLGAGDKVAELQRGGNSYGGPIIRDHEGNVFLNVRADEPISSIMRN